MYYSFSFNSGIPSLTSTRLYQLFNYHIVFYLQGLLKKAVQSDDFTTKLLARTLHMNKVKLLMDQTLFFFLIYTCITTQRTRLHLNGLSLNFSHSGSIQRLPGGFVPGELVAGKKI